MLNSTLQPADVSLQALIRYDHPTVYWNELTAVGLIVGAVMLAAGPVVLSLSPDARRRVGLAPYDEKPLRWDQQLSLLLGPALVSAALGVGWFIQDIGYALLAALLEGFFLLLSFSYSEEHADQADEPSLSEVPNEPKQPSARRAVPAVGDGGQRPKLGDIIEIVTPRGKVYAQFSHENGTYRECLRVLPGIWQHEPRALADLAAGAERFYVFYPLAAAVDEGLVRVVAHEDVPPHARTFPVFRSGVRHPTSGVVESWWLWDGESEWPVISLTEGEQGYSSDDIVSHKQLVERIATDWSPRQEFRLLSTPPRS